MEDLPYRVSTNHAITNMTGKIPYRMALAGGWIDQPFISRCNPSPPGSMVVVGIEPVMHFMDRAGMATGTRQVAQRIWDDRLPDGDPSMLVQQLYVEENKDLQYPSGSQDMIGLIYPGVNRLDYDYSHEQGIFPRHIESNRNKEIALWLQQIIHMIPVAPRPHGYNPLGIKNLDPQWIARLGQTGRDCYNAILNRNMATLGASMNECMLCWENLLPHTVRHPAIKTDLVKLLKQYQLNYPGAMYSGCGGGYLYVVSEKPVPGAFQVKVRI
jgi:hypothetical protein